MVYRVVILRVVLSGLAVAIWAVRGTGGSA